MDKLIGRDEERNALSQYTQSERAEFVAIYGRRRVGKTFLVDSYFNYRYAFSTSGIIGGTKKEEMRAFYTSLVSYGYKGAKPKDWMGLFSALREILEANLKSKKGRCVIFIDELPCFDTQKSGFVHALDYFWNSWASKQDRIFLIACGSATSWIVRNIIDNHGGLHNRLTHEIYLKPFTLKETESYLKSRGAKWSRLNVLNTYMILGGIPYYLSLLDTKLSPASNIDRLFFAEKAELKSEYNRLYASLFRNPERYMKTIEILSKCKQGLTRKEITRQLKITDNGHFGRVLTDLENCGFIRQYNTFSKTIKENSGIFQLVDFFTLFYHTFGKNKTTNEHYWSSNLRTAKLNTWYGLAFEKVCLTHIPQIKKAIGIDKIHAEYYSWQSKNQDPNAQIDLVLDRADDLCNVCEIKYSKGEYTLTKSEYLKILNRANAFEQESGTNKGIHLVMITTFGLNSNCYSDIMQSVVNLNDMFV